MSSRNVSWNVVTCEKMMKNAQQKDKKKKKMMIMVIMQMKWLHAAEEVSGVEFSDYISIDLDIAACGILSIEEMCDEETKDNIQADEAEPTPIPSLSWKF